MKFYDLFVELKEAIARRKTRKLKALLNKEFLLRISGKSLGFGSAVGASLVAAIIWKHYEEQKMRQKQELKNQNTINLTHEKVEQMTDVQLRSVLQNGKDNQLDIHISHSVSEPLPPVSIPVPVPVSTPALATLAEAKIVSAAEKQKEMDMERSNETWDMLRNVLGNSSPFENFELILFFPSCGFWFIFLFTSFNLVLFQIIFMLFNLHEYFISTFKPNSFILRFNAVLMNFLFNLHCSQSYSRFLLKYFPITLTVFVFILFGNLTGLLPWSFSYTGHIGLTFSLAIMLFQGWLVVSLDRLGGDFWALFIYTT
jgi:ATP synthase A chain